MRNSQPLMSALKNQSHTLLGLFFDNYINNCWALYFDGLSVRSKVTRMLLAAPQIIKNSIITFDFCFLFHREAHPVKAWPV